MYLLEGMFARLAHPVGGEFWLRIPGIAASLLTLLVILRSRALLGFRRAVMPFATAFGATFPLWIDWATGARGYGWLVLLGFLQWVLLAELSRPAKATNRSHPIRKTALLAAASVAGILIHPFYLIWSLAVFAGLIWARFLTAHANARNVPNPWIWGSAAAAGAGQLLWIGAQAIALRIQGFPTGGAPPAWTIRGMLEALYSRWKDIWEFIPVSIGVAAIAAFVARRLWRIPWTRPLIITGAVALLSHWFLLLYVSVRFFPALRYFALLTVPLFWIVVCGVQITSRWLRSRFARRSSAALLAITPLVVAGVSFPFAFYNARTPHHDWRGAMQWLRNEARDQDIVLCGPNSDTEIVHTYWEAARLPGIVPLSIDVGRGKAIIPASQPDQALRVALQSVRRIWFLTPYYGAHRSPTYWNTIAANFRLRQVIPGRAPISIYEHPASGKP